MNSDVPTSKVCQSENIVHLLENLLGHDLEDTLAAISADTAALENFLATRSEDTLEHHLTPQWVVLAAGKGTRIDPTGRLSKTLDITFGEQNMLQHSRRYLPGNRPDIVVINPQMASRIEENRICGAIARSRCDTLYPSRDERHRWRAASSTPRTSRLRC